MELLLQFKMNHQEDSESARSWRDWEYLVMQGMKIFMAKENQSFWKTSSYVTHHLC